MRRHLSSLPCSYKSSPEPPSIIHHISLKLAHTATRHTDCGAFTDLALIMVLLCAPVAILLLGHSAGFQQMDLRSTLVGPQFVELIEMQGHRDGRAIMRSRLSMVLT